MGARRPDRGRIFRADPASEVQDELEFHLEQRMREFMAEGMDEETARRAAVERIGNVDRVRSECADLLASERRALARRDWLSDLGQDLRFAVRGAARAPLFTMMAVLTLALGIGANSAVFGVVKSVLLDALPYAEPERLVRIRAYFPSSTDGSAALSAGTVWDTKQRQRSFGTTAASISGGPDAVLQKETGAETVRLAWVEAHFFGTLGVSAALGRTFDAADVADTSRVVVLTHGAWQRHFGGDASLVGRALVLNGLTRTVIGVLPARYVHPTEHADVFMPFAVEPLLANPVNARGSHFLELVARLNPDASVAAADAEMDAIGRALAAEWPRDNEGVDLRAVPLHETMMGDTRTPLLVLMGSAALVLLIACANLAAALLSRTIARRKEFAVRVSLGAGRSRLVRQLLAESLLLAVAGGAAGLLIANAGLGLLRGAELEAIPDYANLTLDSGAVLFTFALALITGIAFGLTPALSVGRAEPQTVLRDETRGATDTRGAGRLRGALVAAQVALCLSLLTGAGLLARSVWRMATEPHGFRTENMLAFNVTLPQARYPDVEAAVRFRDEMMQRLAGLPAVRDVALTTFLPTRVQNSNGVVVVGRESPTSTPPFILTTGASENLFDVMGIRVIAGRTFTTADDLDSPPVAVISQAMAQRFFPDGDALGQRIRVGPDPESTPIEVIGVVADVRTRPVELAPEPLLYFSLRQGWWGSTFLVHTAGDPLHVVSDVRRELAAFDAAIPMSNITTLHDVIAEGLAPRRVPMLLMLTFGALALLLACIGIYALFANLALAREREFGVRMALGSSRRAVAALVLRQGALWMAAGLAGGALGVFAVSRVLRSLVYGIAPLDPVSILAAVCALLVCAGVALALPVHRATRADPLSVMR